MTPQISPPLISRYRQLSPSAAVFVSPLCLGTMNFGDKYTAMMGECSKETAFKILDDYFEQGGNFIDTANSYHDGQTETWLGDWMASRKNRNQIVLATKYTGPHRISDQSIKIRANYGGNGMKSLRLTLDDSLERMQTDYVDILWLHWWNYTATIPEVMHGLNDFVASGKVLYLGISDSPAWVVAKANQYARDHGLRQFVVYQGPWNAALRDLEREIVPMCRDEQMGICAYSPLNSGRFQTESIFKERQHRNPGRANLAVAIRDRQVSKVLEEIALTKNTNLTNVALAYIFQKEPYVFPIVGGRKLEHLKDNMEALSLNLTDEDVAQIDKAYNFEPGFPQTFLSGSIAKGADAPQQMATWPSEVAWMKAQGTFDWVRGPQALRPAPQ